MTFRGLFIGIDRYASPEVDELTCARRDAVALHALFTDTLGGASTLLTDADATRTGIEAAFAELADCALDDTVVVTFSGHGSEDHQLVAHDTALGDLPGTSVPLELLQSWFARIPARRLVLILDCCFSGGLGAKVLHLDYKARGPASTDARLEQLAGDGRVIFTASGANEPAYEHTRFGHGFLTHFLLGALQGAPEVVSGGRVSLYTLLGHVTRRVQAAALQIGRPQTPTMRGQLDGDLYWPIFVMGERFRTAFPAKLAAKVDASVSSLQGAGFPGAMAEAWGAAIPNLNALQITAVNDYGLLKGEHLVVSAPTSSGKTMIGELAAIKCVLERRRALFLLPLKALVADKRRQFEAVYEPFGIRVFEATGETDDITPLLKGKYDIGLLTYEKFAAIALSFPHLLLNFGVVVVDEAQMIADRGRGANLEFLLTLLRMRRRADVEPQIIALSAVIGDTNGLEEWLGGRLLRRSERPVPLDEGLLLFDGSFRHLTGSSQTELRTLPLVAREYGKGTSQDWIIPLVRKLVAAGQQVIVFRETKGAARGCANYLAKALALGPAIAAVGRLPVSDPSQASHDLRGCLAEGVAFHHSDLTPEERRIVEEEFRRPESGLRVIAATTTLAMGVNTPASSVIIAGLEHPGEQPYSVAEYKNLVGRAGRLGYTERGASYLLALSSREEHDLWRRYVTGAPEDLESRFLDVRTDPRSLIVRVLASADRVGGEGVRREDIIDFLEASFGAFQAARRQSGWAWSRSDLEEALSDLLAHSLIDRGGEGVFWLTALGRLAGESGVEVRSVIRIVDALRPLAPQTVNDPALLTATQLAVELDEVYFPLNKRSTQKEPFVWAQELRLQGVPQALLSALQRTAVDQQQATLRAKRAASCLLFISGRPMTEIEQIMTQFGGAFGGAAGPIRGAAARTCDLLPTTARIAGLLHPGHEFEASAERVIIRLTHGVVGAAVDLAREAGAMLLRGDYCRLTQARLCGPTELETASDEALLACLDQDRRKLEAVRIAGRRARERTTRLAMLTSPLLTAYVA